jgi:hypothetical protein
MSRATELAEALEADFWEGVGDPEILAAAELRRLERVNAEQQRLLAELHALVWGECPSLLNEDSGGNSALDLDIRAALTSATGDKQ